MLEIPSFQLKGPDFTASADSKLDFRDKSNPHIYFRVKSPFMPLATVKHIIPTSLIPPWVEEKLFPILSGGEARLDHYSMNGTLDQYKDLHLPENSGVLSTKVELKEFDAFKNGGALPFETVSGEFSIENGALSAVVTNAVFGNSTLTKASLDIDHIYGKPTNSIVGEGLFDLEDLWQQEKLCPMPQDLRKKIQAFQTASGEVKGHIQIDFNEDWTCPRIIEGKFLGRNCLLVHEDLVLPLSLDEAEALIDAGVGNSFRGTGHWGKSEFQTSGSTGSQWEDAKVQIEARIRMDEMMDRFNHGRQLHLEYKDLVPFQATLSRMDKAWACQGSLNPSCVTINTDAVHVDPPGKDDRAVFDLEIYPDEKVNLKHMRCNLGKSAVEMTGSWDLKDKGGINFEALTQGLHLEDLGIRFKKQNVPAGGVISCNVAIRKFPRDPSSSLSLTGTAVGKDVSFTLEEIPLPIHDCHFKLDFSENDVFIRSLGMGMGQSSVNIEGQLKGWHGLTGRLDIDAEYLDFSEFIFADTGTKEVKPALGPFIKKSDIQLNLVAHKGQWKKLSYSPLQAEGVLRSGDFFIKHAEARLEHGTFSLKGHVKSTDGPKRIRLVCKTQLENQPVDDFLYSLGFEKKALGGALTMDGWVSTKGNGKRDLISGLQGNANVQVGKGLINSPYGLFYKILNVLSLQNILKGRLPDLSKESFPFDHLEARFTARDGILETDDFSIKSPILNLVAPGKIDLVKEHIDVVVWVQTLETMDSVVSKVPIIGYIMTEKECAPKGILLYPIEVKGLLSDPKIKYRPSMLRLGSGVFNIFKRILNIPAHYFKKISGWGKEEEENVALPPDFGTELECGEVKNETLDNQDK